jgi:hypothetical protein
MDPFLFLPCQPNVLPFSIASSIPSFLFGPHFFSLLQVSGHTFLVLPPRHPYL